MSDKRNYPTTIVHNVWTVYGLNPDGSEASEAVALKQRPQDWGDPKWYYELYRFDRWIKGEHYINYAHCWTDLKKPIGEYAHLFSQMIVSILIPGDNELLCGKQFLADDDFWNNAWGARPPHHETDEQDFELEM